MDPLQPNTELQGGKYTIIKVLSQNSYEISYLANEYGWNHKVIITEFFMKDFCERDGKWMTLGTEDVREEVVKMRERYKKDYDELWWNQRKHDIPRSKCVIDTFYENQTVYNVKLYDGEKSTYENEEEQSEPLKLEGRTEGMMSSKPKYIILIALIATAAFVSYLFV